MDHSPDLDWDGEDVSVDDVLVSGPADPREIVPAWLCLEVEKKVTEFKESVSQFDNCDYESETWSSGLRKELQDLLEWLLQRFIAEVRQNTSLAAIASGIFLSDLRERLVAMSGGRFKIEVDRHDGARSDPLAANHAHEKRTTWNAARKHPDRRSDVYKLTAMAWEKSRKRLGTLLLLRECEQNFVDLEFVNHLYPEVVELANCMEPSERECLLKLYDNQDVLGWFDKQVWPRIEKMGEEAIRKEYPRAIERAESIQKERPSEGKDATRRSLMRSLRRACKNEFVKKIGPKEFA